MISPSVAYDTVVTFDSYSVDGATNSKTPEFDSFSLVPAYPLQIIHQYLDLPSHNNLRQTARTFSVIIPSVLAETLQALILLYPETFKKMSENVQNEKKSSSSHTLVPKPFWNIAVFNAKVCCILLNSEFAEFHYEALKQSTYNNYKKLPDFSYNYRLCENFLYSLLTRTDEKEINSLVLTPLLAEIINQIMRHTPFNIVQFTQLTDVQRSYFPDFDLLRMIHEIGLKMTTKEAIGNSDHLNYDCALEKYSFYTSQVMFDEVIILSSSILNHLLSNLKNKIDDQSMILRLASNHRNFFDHPENRHLLWNLVFETHQKDLLFLCKLSYIDCNWISTVVNLNDDISNTNLIITTKEIIKYLLVREISERKQKNVINFFNQTAFSACLLINDVAEFIIEELLLLLNRRQLTEMYKYGLEESRCSNSTHGLKKLVEQMQKYHELQRRLGYVWN